MKAILLLGNIVFPFKGRRISLSERVLVYRNLRGRLGFRYSIRQNGLVVGHAEQVFLKHVTFKVCESGRQRVLREKRKNVHAFAIGYMTDTCGALPTRIHYNPYKMTGFQTDNAQTPVTHAYEAVLNNQGISANVC